MSTMSTSRVAAFAALTAAAGALAACSWGGDDEAKKDELPRTPGKVPTGDGGLGGGGSVPRAPTTDGGVPATTDGGPTESPNGAKTDNLMTWSASSFHCAPEGLIWVMPPVVKAKDGKPVQWVPVVFNVANKDYYYFPRTWQAFTPGTAQRSFVVSDDDDVAFFVDGQPLAEIHLNDGRTRVDYAVFSGLPSGTYAVANFARHSSAGKDDFVVQQATAHGNANIQTCTIY